MFFGTKFYILIYTGSGCIIYRQEFKNENDCSRYHARLSLQPIMLTVHCLHCRETKAMYRAPLHLNTEQDYDSHVFIKYINKYLQFSISSI